jgi:transcriptional regulator with XRE-family HTH domain
MINTFKKEEFGERVRKCRMNMGLSQAEFAERLNITQASLSRIEKGVTGALASTVRAICTVTKVTSDYLLGLPSVGENLTPQERALLDSFRALTTKRRYDVLTIVEGFVCAEQASERSGE